MNGSFFDDKTQDQGELGNPKPDVTETPKPTKSPKPTAPTNTATHAPSALNSQQTKENPNEQNIETGTMVTTTSKEILPYNTNSVIPRTGTNVNGTGSEVAKGDKESASANKDSTVYVSRNSGKYSSSFMWGRNCHALLSVAKLVC